MTRYFQRREATQVAHHWVNFAAIAVLSVTGLAIFFGAGGTSSLFAWHLWAAWVLIATVVFHVWYSTVAWKRFDRMWLTWAGIQEGLARLRSGGAGHGKHKHYKFEQIAYHWFVALDVLGLIVTGLILWQPARLWVGPFWLPWGWDAVYVARLLHDLFTFVLVGAVLAHVYFALCVPKNWLLLRSIFNGRVRLDDYAKEHQLPTRVETRPEGGDAKGAGVARSAN